MSLIVVLTPVHAGSLGQLLPSATPVDVPDPLAFDLVGRGAARWVQPEFDRNPAAVRSSGLALPRYRAALAATAANTADTRIAYLGDSTVAGAYASGVIWDNCRPFCPPVLLGNWLKQNLGLPVSLDAAFGQGNPGVALLYDPRVTRVGWTGLNDGTPGGLGGGSYRNDTNQAASVNFQFSDTFDTIEVDYLTNSGGANFTISINGGAALGATVPSNGALARATVTRTCTPGAHTVNINRLVGAGFICIFAVRVRSSTTRRVLVWNWGTGATAVSDWLDTTNVWSPGTYGPALAPHLVLVQLGINDAINGVTNATALTNYQALVNLYRPFADVVFVTPTPVAAGSASLANQRGIVTACRQIAQQNGCPLIDCAAIFGTQEAGAAAGYFAPANDPVHPGPAGYAAMAEAVTGLPGLLRS
jgi:lysophospholipase L1-like esterase